MQHIVIHPCRVGLRYFLQAYLLLRWNENKASSTQNVQPHLCCLVNVSISEHLLDFPTSITIQGVQQFRILISKRLTTAR